MVALLTFWTGCPPPPQKGDAILQYYDPIVTNLIIMPGITLSPQVHNRLLLAFGINLLTIKMKLQVNGLQNEFNILRKQPEIIRNLMRGMNGRTTLQTEDILSWSNHASLGLIMHT